ncbi:MAG: cell division protein FtsZ [Bacteroidales bacterium]|nr:cell division protein FtsZ [Bacteroidales bacterium]MCF8333297.1 cell division protein FtsZ [Bacteroidales bacterium]
MPMLKFNNTKNIKNSIKVIGVGGGGSNAVDNMFREGIKDVDFIVANTDAQALEQSSVPVQIQLGKRGKGAGNNPQVGKEAALESQEQIEKVLDEETEMVFITSGMGGGTGTGSAPVIASIAREQGILTVGIVTTPFSFEGPRRKKQADAGIAELRKYVDTILVIVNDRLRELHQDMKMSEAFKKADNILTTAAKGIAELVTVPGNINLDFEDVKSVMQNGGKSIMSSATADGENRALDCAEMVLTSPLLADSTITGAKNILLYLASSPEKEMSVNEMHDITDYIREKSGGEANLIFGNSIDDSLEESIRITLVATGFESTKEQTREQKKKVTPLYNPKNEPEQNKSPEEPYIKKQEEEEDYQYNEDMDEDPASEPEPNDEPQASRSRKIHYLVPEDTPEEEAAEPEDSGQEEKNEQDNVSEDDYSGHQRNTNNQNNSTRYSNLFDEDDQVGNFQFKTRKSQPKTEPDSDTQKHEKKARDRIAKLAYTGKMKRRLTEKEREKMEKIPAYKRKNMDLEDTQSSEEENDPEYVLGKNKNNETVIKKNNGYIHKNID